METFLVIGVAVLGFGLVVGLEGLAARRKEVTGIIHLPALRSEQE
jgi:type IV secretory pathway VirB2 component (pilin)